MQRRYYVTKEGDNIEVLVWNAPEDPWNDRALVGESIHPLVAVDRWVLDTMELNEVNHKRYTLSNGNYFDLNIRKDSATVVSVYGGLYDEDDLLIQSITFYNLDLEYGEAGVLSRVFVWSPAIINGELTYNYFRREVVGGNITVDGNVANGGLGPGIKVRVNSTDVWSYIPTIQPPTMAEVFYGDAETVEPFDPFDDATDVPIGGGGGTFDYSGNPPGDDTGYTFPTISAADAGFITIYNPTTAELKQLASYLWSNGFNLDSLKKLFNNPMDLFLSLAVLPVPIPDGGRAEVGIGLIHTGVIMTRASSQWVSLVCGSVTIPKLTGSYLDYDPYTSVQIYLPFVGVKTLRADEVVGRTLRVAYKIDILSGACVAWISVDNHVIYSFMGQCSMPVPMNSSDSSGIFAGLASIVAGAAVGAAKGGGAGAIAGGLAAASSVAVADGKIDVTRSGTIASTGGFLAHKKPFLIINAPRLRATPNQQKYEGFPSYWTYKLANLTGFTIVEQINLSNVHATEDELSEIKQLLMSGVIL